MTTPVVHTINPLTNPFAFLSANVRTAIDERGGVWFCARDVFEALGIEWKGKAGSLKNCPEKWQVVCYLQTSNGAKDTIFISEAGVYQTTFSSRKPEAEAFAEWVCEEVLPSIRRQGFYAKPGAADPVRLTAMMLRILDRLKGADAFNFEVLTRRLRSVCNLLGEPMPDPALIGADRFQQRLPGV